MAKKSDSAVTHVPSKPTPNEHCFEVESSSEIKNLGEWQTNEKNEIMLFAPTWMDLEIIILSEVNQKEKDKYYMTSLICEI